MKTLEFDAGNTRLKWRLREYAQTVGSGFLANDENWGEALPILLDRIGQLEQVNISIVSGDERYQRIRRHVLKTQSVSIYKAVPKKECAGVELAYKDAEAFGVDRWLAMLAANALGIEGTKVVVDCGTAITIDIVNQKGLHLGGYVMPGISLMRQALAINTSKLEFVESSDMSLVPGKASAECISHGTLAMSVAVVDRVVDDYPDSRVILTGGDAGRIKALLNTYKEGRVVLKPSLVMDGLMIAAREELKECVG